MVHRIGTETQTLNQVYVGKFLLGRAVTVESF